MAAIKTQPLSDCFSGVPVARPAQPAIVALVRREGAFVMRIVRRLGVAEPDVEDVAQEVFVTLHRRQADYRDDVPVRSWIFGIVRRTVANHLRRAHLRHEEMSGELNDVSDLQQADEAVQRVRDRDLLERALAALSADKREVFVLFELEGLDMREVAGLVDCPLKTAYSRLYAAREVVRRVVLSEREAGGGA